MKKKKNRYVKLCDKQKWGRGGAEKGYKKRYKKNMCEKIIINACLALSNIHKLGRLCT